MNGLIAIITILLGIFLCIEGAAISFLVANTIGGMIIINRINNPVEFTIKLIKDMKNNVANI